MPTCHYCEKPVAIQGEAVRDVYNRLFHRAYCWPARKRWLLAQLTRHA